MKRHGLLCCMMIIALTMTGLAFARAVSAQSGEALNVDEAVICRNVVDRTPVGSGTNFPSSAGELFCFTRILGAKTPTRISHVWYFGNVERARIDLAVKAAHWRTFSKKIIRPGETGVWHVDVLDAAGNRLEVLNFHIDEK